MSNKTTFAVTVTILLAGATFFFLRGDRSGGSSDESSQAVAPDAVAGLPQGAALSEPPLTRQQESTAGRLLFEDGTIASGVTFHHVATRSTDRLMPEIMGGGVVIADFNRDGAPDIVLIGSGDLASADRPASALNRLYLNDGHGVFRDTTDAWNLPSPGYGMGAAAGDYNNDGWTDLFLTTYGGPDTLLMNTGNSFVDVTAEADIIDDGRWSTSAAFLDMDGDGDLDLYIVRYVDYDHRSAIGCYNGGLRIYCTPIMFDAQPDRLLVNNGDGTFTDVSTELGNHLRPAKGLAVAAGDIDWDGDTDLYIANDTSRNFLLMGDGRGNFVDRGVLTGAAYSDLGLEEGSMGADFSDVDADGLLDIVCTNFQAEPTSIYKQQKGFYFLETSDRSGVGRTSRRRLSFGVDFFDADNDGDEDLLVANGHIEDNVAALKQGIEFAQPDSLYENLGDGSFRDVSTSAGSALQVKRVSRGLATADLNGDGALDYVATENDGPVMVGMNRSSERGAWVTLWLEGVTGNRSAIGARVEARVGSGVDSRVIRRQVMGASSYLSACDLRVHIGLGPAEKIDELTIHWPGGRKQVIRDLPPGNHYRITEGKTPEPFEPGARQWMP